VDPETPPTLEYGSPTVASAWSLTRVIAWMCVYPLMAAAFVYGTWVAAALALGRRPEMYADDPSGINGTTRVMQVASVLLLFAGMPLMLLHLALAMRAVLWSLTHDGRRDWRRLRSGVLAIVVWVVFWVVIIADPGRVTDWLMD
jgi:hypothetical protein